MAAQPIYPVWDYDCVKKVQNRSTSAIEPNLFLTTDGTTYGNAAKIPATSTAPTHILGVAPRQIDAGSTTNPSVGEVVNEVGSQVVVKAGTGGVTVGARIIVDVASGKEGRGKAYSSGAALIVGIALSAADDGDLFAMRLLNLVQNPTS